MWCFARLTLSGLAAGEAMAAAPTSPVIYCNCLESIISHYISLNKNSFTYLLPKVQVILSTITREGGVAMERQSNL